jgi:4'-phosphopantetheinyl transferase
VDVYITDIRAFSDNTIYERALGQITSDRSERTRRLKNEADRRRSVGAGLLLELGLNERGISLIRESSGLRLDWILYGEYGKPFLRNSQIQFCLSHSGDYAVAVFSDRAVGIDIERVRTANSGVVSRFFSDIEQSFWEQNMSALSFTRLWTRKESVIKATGDGLHMPLDSFSVLDDTVRIPALDDEHEERCFSISTLSEPEGYVISVCEENTGTAPVINLEYINI